MTQDLDILEESSELRLNLRVAIESAIKLILEKI